MKERLGLQEVAEAIWQENYESVDILKAKDGWRWKIGRSSDERFG